MLIRCMALIVLTAILGACAPSRDGELQWQFQIKKSHMQWGVVDAGRLYLCADDVYCLDIATGRLLWEFKTFGTHASAPVVDDGRLYFQCGGLYALDAVTGSVLWEFWTNDWATAAPAAGAGKVYAPAGDRLYCLDAADGKRLWSVTTGVLSRPPVVTDHRLFFCSEETTVCLDAENGQVLWRSAIDSRGQLAYAQGYLLSVGFEGRVRAHRVSTGEVQWQRATDVPLVHLYVSEEGHLYISAGALYCVNPETGDSLWTFNAENIFVRDAHAFGQYVIARTWRNELLVIVMHDGSLVRTARLPDGGRLLTDGTRAVFLPGGKSRTVSSVVISGA